MSNLILIDNVDNKLVETTLNKIASFQKVVQSTLKEERDYGVIPGTQKPTLMKPGAEKICMLFGASPEYVFESKIEDYDKEFFAYTIKCTLLRNGQPVAQGVGSCNSKEGKYRYKNVKEEDIPSHLDKDTLQATTDKWGRVKYKIESDDACSIANTVLKMAKKRAYVDATLQIGALSEIFTQDIEDMEQFQRAEKSENMTVEEVARMKMPFGKHKGITLGEIYKTTPDYVDWFLDKGNDPDIKKAFKMLADAVKEKKAKKDVVEVMETVAEEDLPEIFKKAQ